MPDKPKSPGRNFASLLDGEVVSSWDNRVFYEFEGLRCIRTSRWKYIHRHSNGPHDFFDLKNDPEEQSNLYGDATHFTIRDQLKHRLDTFYAKNAQPKYDMWHGGSSQTRVFLGIELTHSSERQE